MLDDEMMPVEWHFQRTQPRWTKTKVAVGLLGTLLLLGIFYYVGDKPWEEGHLCIGYATTKTFNQTCWSVKREVYTVHNFSNEWLNHNATMIQQYFQNQVFENYSQTKEQGLVEDAELQQGTLILYGLFPTSMETREVKANWIQVDGKPPHWYFNQACVTTRNLTYWEEEVVQPAPHRRHRCHQLIPKPTLFMGHMNFSCDTPESQHIPVQEPGNQPDRNQRGPGAVLTGNGTTAVNITARLTPKPARKKKTSGSKTLSARFVNCMREKTLKLDPCMWNLGPIRCEGQQYLVLSRAHEYPSKGRQGPDALGEVYIDSWLNDSLPWVWRTAVAHLRADQWTLAEGGMENLHGPETSIMYVQKLPTPEDLWSVPQGDFNKIDRCVLDNMFRGLNNTSFTYGEGLYGWASPRCDIWQVGIWESGGWMYDCRRHQQHQTMKGALQMWPLIWAEPEKSRPWWGLQESEVKAWVLPCLKQTNNYWLKYQYVATVYSKADGVADWHGWTGYRPYATMSPRPWKMTCNKDNSSCTVELARQSCETLPGWEQSCRQWYQDRYHTYQQGVTWVKTIVHLDRNLSRVKKGDPLWQRTASPWNRGCVKTLLGPMLQRQNINRHLVPHVSLAEMIRLEGHAFRKSLCEGTEVQGFQWIGPNRMYNNGTCDIPAEHWQKCGDHECSVAELYGRTVLEAVKEVPKEVLEKIEEGAVDMARGISGFLRGILQYVMVGLGAIILILLTLEVTKLLFHRVCQRRKRRSSKEEELDSLF